MARGATPTKVSLDRWAQILGINPFHFNGITTDALRIGTCAQPWMQHAWQNAGQISREDVATFIKAAEDDIERYLGYRLLPTWEVQEEHRTHDPGIADVFNLSGLNHRGFHNNVQTDWGHFISGGIQSKTELAASVPVIYTDEDGDSYKETATIQLVSSAVTDPEEVAVYFPGYSGADEWEVRPLDSVTISGSNITIKCKKHQLVNPLLWEGLNAGGIDGDEDSNFLSVVDVYRVHNDPSQQATLVWEPNRQDCVCSGSGCAACSFTVQTGCLHSHDLRLGQVAYQSATWDSTDEEFDAEALSVKRNPDRVRLWYRAGHQDRSLSQPTRQMSRELERMVVYYSLALMDRPVCGCDNLREITRVWVEDVAAQSSSASGNSLSFKVSQRVLDCPLGTKRGAIYAWRRITQQGLNIGHAVRV